MTGMNVIKICYENIIISVVQLIYMNKIPLVVINLRQ